jgi:hypothetical protein
MRLPTRTYRQIKTDKGRVFVEFTGYTDGHGNNVYFGDILTKGEIQYKVIVCESKKQQSFCIEKISTGNTQPIHLFNFKDSKIIGNEC